LKTGIYHSCSFTISSNHKLKQTQLHEDFIIVLLYNVFLCSETYFILEKLTLLNQSLINSVPLYTHIGPLGPSTEGVMALAIVVDQPAKFLVLLYVHYELWEPIIIYYNSLNGYPKGQDRRVPYTSKVCHIKGEAIPV
jgi:hypothetical protein